MRPRSARRVAAILVYVAVPLAVPGTPPSAQEPAFPLDKLPGVARLGDETTAYLYRVGWEELREKLRGTTALAVIEDPQVRAFFDEVLRPRERKGREARLYELVLTSLHADLVMAGAAGNPSRTPRTPKSSGSWTRPRNPACNRLRSGLRRRVRTSGRASTAWPKP